MSDYLFVIGDIHGELDLFNELLKDYEPSMHQLVLIGDLLDRGLEAKKCLLLGKELVETTGAIYLKGNHEDLLLRFLDDPEERYKNYLLNGGGETIESLLHPGAVAEYSATEIAMMIRSRYKELVAFLKELPLYYEWQHYVCVHAGVNLELSDWKQTSERDFLWIRKEFHEGNNQTGKQIIFGHTPTMYLYEDNNATKLWHSDNKIGIDGGGVYGGSVHGVIINELGLVQDIEVRNQYEWEPTFLVP